MHDYEKKKKDENINDTDLNPIASLLNIWAINIYFLEVDQYTLPS